MIIKYIRKCFSFVVFVVLFIGSVHAAIAGNQITFPAGAPGLQADVMFRGAGIYNGHRFKHFQVNGNNLYFPVDGTQPTTQQAASWSCAHIQDPAITKWYMYMFGKIESFDANKTHISTSNGYFGTDQYQCSIIKINTKKLGLAVSDSDAKILLETEVKTFWEVFEKIAANPVGRVLLYRILIEIRRQQGNQSKDDGLIIRNLARSVTMIISDSTDYDWTYLPANSNAKLGNPVDPDCSVITVKFNFQKNVLVTNMQQRISLEYTMNSHMANECNLFHEMLHWYHHLVNFNRFNSENLKAVDALSNNDYPAILGYKIDKDETQYSYWIESSKVKIEEMRNFCGSYNQKEHKYEQGDDLSENAFRATLGAPMRFGHNAIIGSVDLDETNRKAILKAQTIANLCLQEIYYATPKLDFWTHD